MNNYKEVLKSQAYQFLGLIEEAQFSNDNMDNNYTFEDLEDAVQTMIESIYSLDSEGLDIE